MGAEAVVFFPVFAIAAVGCWAAGPVLATTHPSFQRNADALPTYGHYLLTTWFWCYLVLNILSLAIAIAEPDFFWGENYSYQFDKLRAPVIVDWIAINIRFIDPSYDLAMIPFTLSVWVVSRARWSARVGSRLRISFILVGSVIVGCFLFRPSPPVVSGFFFRPSPPDFPWVLLFALLFAGTAVVPFVTGAVGKARAA